MFGKNKEPEKAPEESGVEDILDLLKDMIPEELLADIASGQVEVRADALAPGFDMVRLALSMTSGHEAIAALIAALGDFAAQAFVDHEVSGLCREEDANHDALWHFDTMVESFIEALRGSVDDPSIRRSYEKMASRALLDAQTNQDINALESLETVTVANLFPEAGA